MPVPTWPLLSLLVKFTRGRVRNVWIYNNSERGRRIREARGGGSNPLTPQGIWILGLGSMFMDISSGLMHSLLPVFMAASLGASIVTIGFVEGIAEATAAVTKVFSGAISDYVGKRKFVVVLGYAVSALAKPLFPLATTMWWVFAARFVDRLGKGIRGAPRDALVADTAPAGLRGTAFGIFNLVAGGALLLASAIAGLLWSALGAPATFLCGAGFAACAALGFLWYRPKYRSTAPGVGT